MSKVKPARMTVHNVDILAKTDLSIEVELGADGRYAPVSRQVALAQNGGPDWAAFARGEARGCDECGSTGRCFASCSFATDDAR